VLTQIDQDIWTMDGPNVVFASVPVPTRSTIVRLASGALWVHSPIALDAEVKHALEQLGGNVGAIVAPNKFHYLSVQAWRDAYPAARVFAEPDLMRKEPALRDAVKLNETVPTLYADDIDQVRVAGNRYFNEVVFLHRQSRSLIVTDLMMNLHTDHQGYLARFLLNFEGVVFPNGGVSRLYRWLTRDKVAARTAVKTLIKWSPTRILLCHGEAFTDDIPSLLQREFSYLL